jgi:hypothetical protein
MSVNDEIDSKPYHVDRDADILQRAFERGIEQAQLAGMRAAWGIFPDVPKVAAPAEPTHCQSCGQKLRRKVRPEFHGLTVIEGGRSD